jgi:hypothetical protein
MTYRYLFDDKIIDCSTSRRSHDPRIAEWDNLPNQLRYNSCIIVNLNTGEVIKDKLGQLGRKVSRAEIREIKRSTKEYILIPYISPDPRYELRHGQSTYTFISVDVFNQLYNLVDRGYGASHQSIKNDIFLIIAKYNLERYYDLEDKVFIERFKECMMYETPSPAWRGMNPRYPDHMYNSRTIYQHDTLTNEIRPLYVRRNNNG